MRWFTCTYCFQARTLTLLGITTTPALSTISVVINAVIAFALGCYAWTRPARVVREATG